ncbi:MAG: prolyl oligopeptidase family serine peptidase [Planctomycetaceae bacterium]|nr:prolyl oligopeptidase family serine peptidase [Planctomycetaceae bacterium]
MFWLTSTTVRADDKVDAETRKSLRSKLATVRQVVGQLPATKGRPPERKEDAAVLVKGVDWLLRHDEFYKPSYAADAEQALELALKRAEALSAGNASWGTTAGKTIRGYRSKVDGSLQPYAVSLPEDYDLKAAKRYPLHVVMHGRGKTLNEVSFIKQHDGKPPADGQTWIQLDVFGRTNNAYRWAGETDVFEAMEDVHRRYKIDRRRVTLWGFSMGGAGAWHLGLQHPSEWSSVGAGAGFVDFYQYQKQTAQLPDWQHRTLRIYDAVDYAMNLHDVPFITYGGELDPQLASSLRMQEEAQKLDAPLKVLVGPQMGHKFDETSLQEFMAFHAEQARKGRPLPATRSNIRFTTCTLKYNRCEWLTLWETAVPYQPAIVESKLGDDAILEIETDNVTAFSMARQAADRVRIDGSDVIPVTGAADGLLPDVYFVGGPGGWDLLDYDDSLSFLDNPSRHKRPDLQGPIDDAFMEPFVCVRGTGEPWSAPHQKWADWTLDRFGQEFDKWMRGRIQVVDDTALTDQQIANRNLVLFGDPGSNRVLARLLEDLPITWTKAGVEVDGKQYDPELHGVALVFPNPLNPDRYVVLNSGMTMHTEDFENSNAWLFPRLGDIAVVRRQAEGDSFTETVEWAEIFDSEWKLP